MKLLLALLLVCGLHAETILLADNFTTYGTGFTFTTLGTNWTVVPGTTLWGSGGRYVGQVDILGVGFYPGTSCVDAGGSDPCVDLVGSAYPAGARLESKGLALAAGTTYRLTFTVAGSQRGNTNAVIVGVSDGIATLASVTLTLPSGAPFAQQQITFTAQTATTARIFFDNSSNLQIADACAGGYPCAYMGALLKDVKLAALACFWGRSGYVCY